jgi:hypothetical protein
MKALARSLALVLALVPQAGRPASSADQLQSCKTDAAEPRSSYDTDHMSLAPAMGGSARFHGTKS